jgi:hypothetical protein
MPARRAGRPLSVLTKPTTQWHIADEKMTIGFLMEGLGIWRCLELVENGAGDGTRTRDVQLGKTLHDRVLNDMAFPETHQSAQCFPSIRQTSANGVTTESRHLGPGSRKDDRGLAFFTPPLLMRVVAR